jgi:hypothetical protein
MRQADPLCDLGTPRLGLLLNPRCKAYQLPWLWCSWMKNQRQVNPNELQTRIVTDRSGLAWQR